MSNRPESRRQILVLVCLGAVILVMATIIGLLRLRPTEGPELGTSEIPLEFMARSADSWITLSDASVQAICKEVANSIVQQAETQALPHEKELAERVSERVEIFIEPQFARWLRLAARAGGDISHLIGSDGNLLDDSFQERWYVASEGLKGSPVATGEIHVRIIAPNAPYSMRTPGTRFMRPSQDMGAAKYPDPPLTDPTIVAVEVLIPVKFRAVGSSSHNLPATAAMRLYRTDSVPDWRPYDFILYFDESSMGKELGFPVF